MQNLFVIQITIAISAFQRSVPCIITTRAEALARYLRHHRVLELILSQTVLSYIYKL